MSRVLDLIYRTSPYEEFPLQDYEPDMQGWGSHEPVFETIIGARRPKVIVEVGTWKGRSAIHMATLCRRHELRCEIICVDTWLGSPELVTVKAKPKNYDSLNYRFGYPQLFYTFMRNVIDAGAQDMITPLPLSSDAAYFVLQQLGIVAELIYIDAGHEYESVIRDLGLYWDLLADNGVLLGDDYARSGVSRAAHEFSNTAHRPVFTAGKKYIMGKSTDFLLPA